MSAQSVTERIPGWWQDDCLIAKDGGLPLMMAALPEPFSQSHLSGDHSFLLLSHHGNSPVAAHFILVAGRTCLHPQEGSVPVLEAIACLNRPTQGKRQSIDLKELKVN